MALKKHYAQASQKRAVYMAMLLACVMLVFFRLGTGAQSISTIVHSHAPLLVGGGHDGGSSQIDLTSDTEFSKCRPPVDDGRPLHQLEVLKTWRSSKRLIPEQITLVTQLTITRLNMLRSQCKFWKHRTAAVVYVPLVNGNVLAMEEVNNVWNQTAVTDVEKELAAFHAATEAGSGCTLDLQLVIERYNSVEDAFLYPINAVRNHALMLAQTDAIFLLDVDFVASASVAASIESREEYEALMEKLNNREALVIPAFEAAREFDQDEAREKTFAAVAENKMEFKKAYYAGDFMGFQTDFFPIGHNLTDFSRWLTSSREYQVNYEEGFEPYILVSRRHLPWYDERFLYRERNKVQHLTHLAGLGFKFIISPVHFVIHVPHDKPQIGISDKATMKAFTNQYKARYQDVVLEIFNGTFVPVTSFCLSNNH